MGRIYCLITLTLSLTMGFPSANERWADMTICQFGAYSLGHLHVYTHSSENFHIHLEKNMRQILDDPCRTRDKLHLQHEAEMSQLSHVPGGELPNGPSLISRATASLPPRMHEHKCQLVSAIEIWGCLLFSIIVLLHKLLRKICTSHPSVPCWGHGAALTVHEGTTSVRFPKQLIGSNVLCCLLASLPYMEN